MNELRHAYSARMVPKILYSECSDFLYYKRFGSKPEVCKAVITNLINTWRGDKDYATWCRDVYSKRHIAQSANEIPAKKDPGPREGKYADVKEFSFPNAAHPEKPCHGAAPCHDETDATTRGNSGATHTKQRQRSHSPGLKTNLGIYLTLLAVVAKCVRV